MVLYRRNRVPGGRYFFTLTLRNRASTTLVDHIDDLRHALASVIRERPFGTVAMVVLPDHLHAVWTLPPGDDDYPGRIRLLKSRFTRRVAAAGEAMNRNAKGGYDVWQPRYWEHTIRNERDLENLVDYIHWIPVKHGHVIRVADWPHSTFHRYVARGIYPADWSGGTDGEGDFGE
jgi:putative transposase